LNQFLTKFVFYFALTAMLFRFAATLPVAELFDAQFAYAYLLGSMLVYALVTLVAKARGLSVAEAAIEAQCGIIGNMGFLGLPMLAVLLGEAAIGPIMMILSIDLIVFSSLIVILINGGRDGQISLRVLRSIAMGLLRNPMIVSISLGLFWSTLSLPIPTPLNDFLVILGGAATPGALFAIGASLARKSAERVEIALWLSFCKLTLHPAFVAIGVLFLFPLDGFSATIVISAAALPVAGNVYMLAQHYGIAPHRVSAAILLSTVASIVSVPIIIALISPS